MLKESPYGAWGEQYLRMHLAEMAGGKLAKFLDEERETL